jgi:hypothetical protein
MQSSFSLMLGSAGMVPVRRSSSARRKSQGVRSDQLVESIPAPLPARQADGAVDPGGCPIEGRHGDLEQKASQGSAVALCIDPGGHHPILQLCSGDRRDLHFSDPASGEALRHPWALVLYR